MKKCVGNNTLPLIPEIFLGGTFVDYNSLKSSGTAFGKTNVVAQTAVVHGGLRFISEEQKEMHEQKCVPL